MTRKSNRPLDPNWLVSALAEMALAVLFLFLLPPVASAQVTDAQASELAKKAVLATLGKPEGSFLDVSPVHALQQLFAQIATEFHGPLPFVFHLTDFGVEHKGNIEIHHLPEWELDVLAAVSASGDVYIMREGSKATPEFNRFAKDYHVIIQTEEQARKYLAWYLAIRLYSSMTELRSAQQLKEEAERGIKGWGESPEKDSANFEAWWRIHEREATRLNYEEQVKRTKRGFLVSFYILSDTDRKSVQRGAPGILRASLEFSTNGEAGIPRFKKISQNGGAD